MSAAKPTIFICYRRHDTGGYARTVRGKMEEAFGSGRVFMDIDSIAPGLDFRQVANEAIQKCDVVLVLIGPNWMQIPPGSQHPRILEKTDAVRNEILAAVEHTRKVVPILLGGGTMPRAAELPPELSDFAYLNAFEITDRHYAVDLGRLTKHINRLLGAGPMLDRRTLVKASLLAAGVGGAGVFVMVRNAPKPAEVSTASTSASSPTSSPVLTTASGTTQGSVTTSGAKEEARPVETMFDFYSRATESLTKHQARLDSTSKVGQWMGFTDEYLESTKQIDHLISEFVALTSNYSPLTSTAFYGEVSTRIALYTMHFLYSAAFFSWGWPGFDTSKAASSCRALLSRLDKSVFQSDGERLAPTALLVREWTASTDFGKIGDSFDELDKQARDLIVPAREFAQRQAAEAKLRAIMLEFDIKYLSLAAKVHSLGASELKLHLNRNSVLLQGAQIGCAYATSRLDPQTWLRNGLLVAGARKDYTASLARAIGAALDEQKKSKAATPKR